MKKRIYFVLLILCCSIASSFAAPAEKYSSVREFLTDQKLIRIAADDTPGYGNQSTSASLISRLRSLGFNGKFEFIYANLTTAKIATLFDLPANVPDVYFDAKNNIEFIKVKEFIARHKNKKNEIVALGMIGRGDDFGCSLIEVDGVDISKGMGELDCSNGANLLDVNSYATISPFYDEYNTITKINDPDPKLPYEEKDSNNKFFVMPVPNLDDAKNYLKNDLRGQELLKNKPGLSVLIDEMEKKDFNFFPLYGFTIQKDICLKAGADNNTCFPENILQILSAARYAQLQGPAPFRKPLVIPVFYNYEKESEILVELFHSENWGEYEFDGAQAMRAQIKELGLANAFFTANISDADFIQKIQKLKPGQILLLSLGSLPKIVFDGLYNFTGDQIWPQIREGANSFNSLVLTGKPHFRCGYNWEMGFDRITDSNFKSTFENFYQNFCVPTTQWKNNQTIYKTLGTFIIDASNPKTALSEYFQQLKTDALKPENDRIYFTLDDIRKNYNF